MILPERYCFDNVIFAHCERDSVALSSVLRHRPFAVLVAPGRDGNWATAALLRTGSLVIRGSALRQGSRALIQLIRLLRSSRLPAAVSVDGPVGPPGKAKGGVVVCAQLTGRLIVPLATAASRRLRFRGSWSDIFLPLPFSHVWIACGEPIRVPAGINRDVIRVLSLELTAQLAKLRNRAESSCG